jgi:hypothetical protein
MPKFDIIDADGHVYGREQELFAYLEEPYAGKKTLLGFPFWPTIGGGFPFSWTEWIGLMKADLGKNILAE